MTTVNDIKLINIPIISKGKAKMCKLENCDSLVPFDLKRIYYLYDIPTNESRGAHAHKELQQLIIASTGSFEIEIFDSINKKNILLNNPSTGLYLPSGLWRKLLNFSSGATCLVFASEKYLESDYIRDIDEYKNFKN